MNYIEDHRINFRKEYIQNESQRKPISPTVASKSGNTKTNKETSGVKNNPVGTSKSSGEKSGNKPSTTSTTPKGS